MEDEGRSDVRVIEWSDGTGAAGKFQQFPQPAPTLPFGQPNIDEWCHWRCDGVFLFVRFIGQWYKIGQSLEGWRVDAIKRPPKGKKWQDQVAWAENLPPLKWGEVPASFRDSFEEWKALLVRASAGLPPEGI